MAAFNVTPVDLTSFGYPQSVPFNDPLGPAFLAKTYTGTILTRVHSIL